MKARLFSQLWQLLLGNYSIRHSAISPCPAVSLRCGWSVRIHGTGTLLLSTGAVPIAAVGRLNLRADSTLSGRGPKCGGDFANETLTGTWTVNANSVHTDGQGLRIGALVRTSVLSGVLDENMTEHAMSQKSLTLPMHKRTVVITFEARRIFKQTE